ncbi:polyprenyl synthetase family protein [Streptomyces sp. ET3-23]|uniref:polyprenyl synthetase family protein n=1 Tax=Streptomyces sp. ET3-23 TaxID=2885643 RepID=UPI001D126886|nr:polyprenyl synthetase family protein [Streptomyces sp. ET3-23]MCC2280859.1 polyprenyl synthetase family protein [Streptomyces sp. ET3-23]
MTTNLLLDQPLSPAAVRTHVGRVLDDFLDRKAHAAHTAHLPGEAVQALRAFLHAGGKRLRPVLCAAGWHAADGRGDLRPVLQVAASLETFHAFCLIHDDIMDNSATRRGSPTMHRALAEHHTPGHGTARAARIGTSAAILIGDLALAWSDELLHTTAGLSGKQLTDILPLIDAMRTEVMYGQYLDATATGHPTTDLDHALAVIRYKTAEYTVERPLHIGAALAGAGPQLLAALSAFALPVGEAFQLRDDLLGVFGDPAATGKPSLDDLRDGKHTALIALPLKRARPAQADQLRLFLGCPTLTDDQARAARRIITDSGAVHTVEEMITKRYEDAMTALDAAPIHPAAKNALHRLADSAVRRHT